MVGKYFLVLAVFFLFVAFVSADFSLGNPEENIKETYGPSADIEGWINVSFSDENANSVLSDSNGKSVELFELLNKSSNSNYTYSCNPLGCATDYTSSNGETSKSFNLATGASDIYGLRFTGNLVSVNSVNFDLQSNAPVSCESPIKVDVLDDGNVEYISNKVASGEGCIDIKSYGCYDFGVDEQEFLITQVPYCQKITLKESPGFSVGAWVKKVSGNQSLRMSVYDSQGNNPSSANCDLPEASSSGGEISCQINYSVTEESDHFVCIFSSSGTGTYNTRGYDAGTEGCGFFGIPLPSVTPSSYEIFAESKKFDAVGTLQIANALPSGNTLGSLVNNYIIETYGSFDCTEECIVPIRFNSGIGQDITLESLSVNYEKTSGVVSEDRFYDLVEIPAKVNSDFGRLFLDDGGFSVPSDLGSYDFSLDLETQNIFSKEVKVEDVPEITSLDPISTASGFPTEFEVGMNSSRTISKYFWDFGDGGADVTTENKASHTYSATGEYNLTITVTDSEEFSASKVFVINVSSPKNLINDTLKNTRESIDRIKTDISGFDFFTQSEIDSALSLDSVESEVEKLQTQFDAAISEEEYNLIIKDLLDIKIPKSVFELSGAPAITFFPNREDIEPDVLEGITGEIFDAGNEDGYINGIILWHQSNIDADVDFAEISGEFETSIEPVVKVFEITVREKKDIGYDYFLILPKLDNLNFETSVLSQEEDGFVYVDLSAITGTKKVAFSTTEDISFVSLPAFISPGFSRLSVSDAGSLDGSGEEGDSRLTIFILAIILLLVAAAIVYVILQTWYKKRYENYLFKNRNDLYNMVNYVNNAKKKGLDGSAIRSNLKKAGWASEQIKYVMKKYSGKRTGMVELPLTKMFRKAAKGNNSK